ncbi:MAG: phosphoesterase family-domain-containing protein [Benjaminiella poitrasii]|nr:MAG: phosphoesterase family-domain-containing protein [Benjaminiella poitrasii]
MNYHLPLFMLLALFLGFLSSYAQPMTTKEHVKKGKYFDRVVIIIMENQDYNVAYRNKFLKSLNQYYNNGILLTNYLAVTHPSQPNYIALTSGSIEGVDENEESNIGRNNIVDLLEAKGVSWKTYQEGYSGNCNKKMEIDKYARRHNPFISYKNIQSSKARCAKIVNARQLDSDIATNSVPQFVFYTPNVNNDAHDTDVDFGSNWLSKFLSSRIKHESFNKNTMFVLTFDEDEGDSDDNHVLTVLFGPDFHPSNRLKKDSTEYNHYSLLKTIEDNWALGNLGKNDKKANLIRL